MLLTDPYDGQFKPRVAAAFSRQRVAAAFNRQRVPAAFSRQTKASSRCFCINNVRLKAAPTLAISAMESIC